MQLHRHAFLIVAALCVPTVNSAELGMGIRVGEVTQDSAIVWTRLTRDAKRNEGGFREPKKREPRSEEFVPSKIKVADREGESAGAPGQVRLHYAIGNLETGKNHKTTEWITVKAADDFVHQFRLTGLSPDTPYAVAAEVRCAYRRYCLFGQRSSACPNRRACAVSLAPDVFAAATHQVSSAGSRLLGS